MLFNSIQSPKDLQAAIPPLLGRTPGTRDSLHQMRRDLVPLTQFDPLRISADDYDEYMNFVESLWNNPSRGLLPERFSMDQALQVLHEARYSLKRAKFYLQFPVLYQVEVYKDKDSDENLLDKRKYVSDLSDDDLGEYLDQYYEGLKKNKSSAEMRWLDSVRETLSADVKSGKEIKRLQNEALFSKFEMPAELKIAIELENKLSNDIIGVLSHTIKDSSDVIRLFKKCTEQNYRPSNFEKLEAEMLGFKRALADCVQSGEMIMSFADLKSLNDRVETYKPIPQFKVVSDRFAKASALKGVISSFLKNQTFKTRGGLQEDKLDMAKALEILKSADNLKVTFDNFDKFKERVDEIVALMQEVDNFIKSDNNEKTVENVNKYLDMLLNCGMEAKQVMTLNRMRDYLEQIIFVEKNLDDIGQAQHNQSILENISQAGFITDKLVSLLEQCRIQIKWKKGLEELESMPADFQIDKFMRNELPPLLKVGKLYDLLELLPKIKLSNERRQLLERHKQAYAKIKQVPVLTRLTDKLAMAKDIYACKLVDVEIATFLDALKAELVFTQEVYSILQVMNVTNQLGPLQEIFEEKVIKPKNVSLEGIEEFLTKNSKFREVFVYKSLEGQLKLLRQKESEAALAIENENYQAISRLEEWTRDNLAMQAVHARLKECLDYSHWRKEVGIIVGRARQKMDGHIIDTCDKLDASIGELEELEEDQDICNWYTQQRQTMNLLFRLLPKFDSFMKVDRLNKLVHDEKSFQIDKDKEIRTDLTQIKEHVDQLETLIAQLSDYPDAVFVPRALSLLGRSYILGVKTNLCVELTKKINYVAESEQSTSVPTAEALEEKLAVFSYLNIWTPQIHQMKILKQWFRRAEDIAEKVVSRVTKQRVQDMSDIVEKMVLNVEDFDAKIHSDIFEISIKRKEKEDPFSLRPRREKKRNQFYATRNLDNKPVKPNKDLIEDIVFNDYTEHPQKFCICNRVGYFKMIQCDFCINWFHIDCLKFNKSSLNKIKKFKCPCCSLVSNSQYDRSIEMHFSERTTLEEYTVLVQEVSQLAGHIQPGVNQQDILAYYNRYLQISEESAVLMKELDNFIESDQKSGMTGEVVRSKALPWTTKLKTFLTHLLGMPFSCPLIDSLAKVLRKFNLLDRIYQMKDKKRVEQEDLHFIDSMRAGQQLRSEFLQKNVAHCEEVLTHLAKIEALDRKRPAFAEYCKQFDKLIKNIKYVNLLERWQKTIAEWPVLEKSLQTKVANPRLLTLKGYREDLTILEKLPFSNEYEAMFKRRIAQIEQWKGVARKHQDSRTPPTSEEAIKRISEVEGILTPSDSDLMWYSTIRLTPSK